MPTKTEKSASKTSSGPKIFDISKPGKSTAAATSRPVIVTNRPIMDDPMVTKDKGNETTTPAVSPSVTKVTIKPLSDTSETDTPKIGAVEMPKIEIPIPEPPEDAKEPEKPADDTADAAAGSDTDKADNESSEPAGSSDSSDDDKSTDDTATAPASDNADDQSPDTTPPADEDKPKPADDTGANLEGKADKETAALEAEARRKEEIAKLVESREYFLPINAIERHRSKVVAALGVCLIVVLGLLLIDVLLDAGFISVPGVHSVTHLFSA